MDKTGTYPPTLRVNVHLDDDFKKLQVSTTRILSDGKIEPLQRGTVDDVQKGVKVLPVLQTAGAIWVKKTKKLGDSTFGLTFEASEILIIKGTSDDGAGSFNLSGAEVVAAKAPPDEVGGE